MNFQLELHTQNHGSNIVFNNIIFQGYKVNIIERYKGKMNHKPQLTHVIFKVRTLDDNLLQTIDGHLRVKVKGDELEAYKKKTAVFVLYKNRRLHTKENEYDYMHFVLSIILANYQLK